MNKAVTIFTAIVGIALTSHGAMTREEVEKFVTEKQITCYHAGDFEGCEHWLLENGATSNMLVDIYTKIAWETMGAPESSFDRHKFHCMVFGIADLANEEQVSELGKLLSHSTSVSDIYSLVSMYHRRSGCSHDFVDFCGKAFVAAATFPMADAVLWQFLAIDYGNAEATSGMRMRIAALAKHALRTRQFPACAYHADIVLADYDMVYRFSARRRQIAADALLIGGACQIGSLVYGHFEKMGNLGR